MLYLGGEVVVHNLLEVLHQEIINHHTDIRGQELALFRADQFLAGFLRNLFAFQDVDGILTFFAFLVTLLHIFALLDGRDGWCIG